MLGEDLAGEREDRFQVDPRREHGLHVGMARELAVENGLAQGPEHERVGRGNEMDRAAHAHDADDRAVEHQRFELGRIEGMQPRPERDVRVLRLLGLHADEPRNGVGHAVLRCALEQELPGERRVVELAVGQDVVGDASIIPRTGSADGSAGPDREESPGAGDAFERVFVPVDELDTRAGDQVDDRARTPAPRPVGASAATRAPM